MANIPFAIGGTQVLCPDLSKSDFSELAGIEYQYLDGSPLYLGFPSVTFVWPLIKDTDVAVIRGIYDTLITGFDPTVTTGSPISVTVPDYVNTGLRSTTGYMLEPTGAAGGDTTRDFKVTFINLHEGSFQSAIANPGGNLWEIWDLDIGTAGFQSTGWQF